MSGPGLQGMGEDEMKLTVVGSGDAFGSGGRLQTCFHIETGRTTVLLDCGATSLIGLARLELDPGNVDTVYITHLHGDHFSGLVWFILHAKYVAKRSRPLVIVGPQTLASRLEVTAEALFPGSLGKGLPFELEFHEHDPNAPASLNGVTCTAREVLHPSGAPAYGLRLEAGGKVLSFSGDTEWVDTIFDLAEGADLHINECFALDGTPASHTSWSVLLGKLPAINARRIMLTHMSAPMLAAAAEIDEKRVLISQDGLQLSL